MIWQKWKPTSIGPHPFNYRTFLWHLCGEDELNTNSGMKINVHKHTKNKYTQPYHEARQNIKITVLIFPQRPKDNNNQQIKFRHKYVMNQYIPFSPLTKNNQQCFIIFLTKAMNPTPNKHDGTLVNFLNPYYLVFFLERTKLNSYHQ